MSRGASVIVAGAGALGLSAALRLAEAGCSVSVWDPAAGPQASAVAAGMLAPVFEAALDPSSSGEFDLLVAARNLWPALAERVGLEVDRSGTAAVGSHAWLANIGAALTTLGVRASDLPRSMLEEMAPGIAPGLVAVLMREDWRIDPRAALMALRKAVEGAGVSFRQDAVRGRSDADWLVIATGAGRDLVSSAPELSRLAPIKGQILRFQDVRGGRVSLRGEQAYAVPGCEGLAIGATMEPGRSDTDIDPAALAPLTQAAGRLFPHLAQATFAVSAGVRAATPDGLPLVGFSQVPRVILATGARRNGWLLAPLAAQIVTACVTGADSGPYGARFDPARFEPGRAS